MYKIVKYTKSQTTKYGGLSKKYGALALRHVIRVSARGVGGDVRGNRLFLEPTAVPTCMFVNLKGLYWSVMINTQ
jgi:hypothetical protein